MLNLVFNAKDDLQRELLAELYKPDVINDILQESESVVTRRKECVKMIAALQQAEEITASVRPSSFPSSAVILRSAMRRGGLEEERLLTSISDDRSRDVAVDLAIEWMMEWTFERLESGLTSDFEIV